MTHPVLATRKMEKNLKVTLGPLRIQKQVPHSPKMKAKLFITYLQKTLENLEDIKKLVQHVKPSSEKIHLQSGTSYLGMNIDSMVIAIHVMVLATRLWTVHSMEEQVLEVQITQSDVGLVITLAMLLLIVTL